jgi:hypothetical protein
MHDVLLTAATVVAAIPNPAPVAPPGVDQAVAVVFSYVKWVAYALCGLAAVIAGARTAIEVRQHGGSGESVKQLLLALVGAGIVSGAVAIVSKAIT